VSKQVLIACCPVHGLHGERSECFVCGGAVEQIPMVPVDIDAATARVLARIVHVYGGSRSDESRDQAERLARAALGV
jgi:hypothetical protein